SGLGGASGGADGWVAGRDAHAEADPDPPGHLAQRAQQHLRTRRAREAREEVVLDEPQVVEAEPVGQHALLEGLLVELVPVDIGAFEGSLRLVEQAESHRRVSWQCALQTVAGLGPRRSRRAY